MNEHVNSGASAKEDSKGHVAAHSPPQLKPWEFVFAEAGARAALAAYGVLAVGILSWAILHPGWFEALVMTAEDTSARSTQTGARSLLLAHAGVAAPFALAIACAVLVRARHNLSAFPVYWAPLLISCLGLPLFASTLFEYRFPYFSGFILLGLGLGVAHAAAGAVRTHGLRVPEISERAAWWFVGGCFLLFTGWMGGMAHWRFITFHGEVYDLSWETNAVHNIVHTGIPRISVGAGSFYSGKLLPANYADAHCPWIYYLYAPFYAIYQDSRTLLWLQAVFMGSGVFGTYLFARRWLDSRTFGAVFALAYALNPNVQTYCLHDVHANPIAIPMVLWALGLMEAKRPKWALFFAFLTCICREETSLYTVAAGLFWALDRAGNRTRMRMGWLSMAMGTTLLLFITQGVMVWAGGKPRYSHFTFYFDGVGMGSILKSYILNPIGFVKLISSPMRLEYIWVSLLPFGFLALFGWRIAWFLLIPIGLLFPAIASNFFVAGMNYSAPVVAPALLMSIFGARHWLRRPGTGSDIIASRRAAVTAFVLTCSVAAGYLYGNIFGKTYKFEFGSVPYRQSNQYDYFHELGVLKYLPPYGERERMLWDLVDRVPKDVPISSSWRLNPPLSNREVSFIYPEDGRAHPKENLAKYIIIDRLPPLTYQPEQWERDLRRNSAFRVYYENKFGVIFERK